MKLRFKSKLEQIIGFGKNIGDSLLNHKKNLMATAAAIALPFIFANTAKAVEGSVSIDYSISSVSTGGSFGLHHYPGAEEGLDGYDDPYGEFYDPSGIAAKAVDTVDGVELEDDVRSTSDPPSGASVSLSIVTENNEPVELPTSTHYINVSVSGYEGYDVYVNGFDARENSTINLGTLPAGTYYDNQSTGSVSISFEAISQPPTIYPPTISTEPATSIGETSATLEGILENDGNPEENEACDYRFSYWKSGETAVTTSWTGSIYENDSFSTSISGLESGSLYYFMAEARNSIGTSSGGSKNFITLSSGSGEPDEPVEPELENLLTIEYTNNQVSKVWNLGLKDGAFDSLDEKDKLLTSENDDNIFSLISDNNYLYESSFDARPKNTNESIYLEVNSLATPESKLKLSLKGFEDKNLTIQKLNPNNPEDFSYLAYDVKDLVNNEEKTGIISLFDPNNPEQTIFPFILDFNSRIAHFPLDETEGNIAKEKINSLDGIVVGDAIWQPNSGKIGGALLLDGIYDYVSTPLILNPAEGPFSVYAWIKGGLPNQSIISQSNTNPRITGGQTWLGLSSEGKLITELSDGEFHNSYLKSTWPITTNNEWHKVGFVWNGLKRHLYLDGKQVAIDNENLENLIGSNTGLYFGAGKNLELENFFSGMIDNVRIYNLPVQDIPRIAGEEKGSFEGFETGDFSKFQWINTSPFPWKIDSEDSYSGNYCAKAVSTNKGDNTKLILTVPCKDGEISFYRKLNSSYYRGLMFYIDNQMVDSWGGEQDWKKFSYPVEEGIRKFTWFSKQDQEITEGEAAWIDDITFPTE